MDKLFRKRTQSNARAEDKRDGGSGSGLGGRSKRNDHSGAGGHGHGHGGGGGLFRKDRDPAPPSRLPAQAPRLPPSLNVEIRNSLILPSLTQRFSVLLPSLSAAPDTTVRSLLAQQRGRAEGPSLTLEEEELLIAELRGGGSLVSTTSEWDGNPPPLEGDWGLPMGAGGGGGDMGGARSGSGSMSASMSSPSMLSRSGSDLAMSPQRGDFSRLSPSGSTSPLAAPGHSPSFSSLHTFGNGDRTPRSYGFSGSQSMRDDHNLRKMQRSTSKVSGLGDDTGDGSGGGPSMSTLPSLSPTSHRRPPLPTSMYPPQLSAANSSSTPQAQKRGQQVPQNDRQASDSPAGSDSTVTSDARVVGTPLSSSRSASTSASASASASSSSIQRKLSGSRRAGPLSPLLPGASSSSSNSSPTDGDGGAGINSGIGGKPRTTPLDARGPHPRKQRQSLMMGLSPSQAQRISMALLELESHLGAVVEGPEEHSRGEAYVVLNDQEEILDHPNQHAQHPIDVSDTQQHQPYHHQNSPARRPSFTSTSATSSVFPFAASPPSSATGGVSGAPSTAAPTPVSKPPSLPSSPRAHNLGAMQSAAGDSPTLPPSSSPEKGLLASPSPATSRAESRTGGGEGSRDSSATSYSEAEYQLPALKPFRPQPVRHTPSPAMNVPGGYVPGQPRPVGSRHTGHGSISSRGSKGSTPPIGSPLSPQAPNGLQHFQQQSQLATRFPLTAGGTRRSVLQGNGAQLTRSHSTNQGSNMGSRSNTPTQGPGRIDHVPAPGVLAARHQASHSIGEFNSWRSGSSLGAASPTKARGVVTGGGVDEVDEDEREVDNHEEEDEREVDNHEEEDDGDHGLSIARPESSSMVAAGVVGGGLALPTHALKRMMTHESLCSTASSTFSMPGVENQPTSWDNLFEKHSSDHAALITPNDDQERADLELLQSMSGMGKEELMAIQGRLVENAKSERDRLRTDCDEPLSPLRHSPQSPQSQESPPPAPPLLQIPQPPREAPSSVPGSATSLPLSAKVDMGSARNAPPTATVWPTREAAAAPSSAAERTTSPTAQFPTHTAPQFPTQHVSRSELPKDPPPTRPPPPPNVAPVPVTAPASGPTSPVIVSPTKPPVPWPISPSVQQQQQEGPSASMPWAAASPTSPVNTNDHGHDRTVSGGRTWLDADPEARRDVEERIHQANAKLFRAPSRSAHKRSLSKKNISSPTLVSYSAKVPTTPISVQTTTPAKKGNDREKSNLGHTLSGKWKKLVKKPSTNSPEVAPFRQQLATSAPLSGPLASQQQQQTQQQHQQQQQQEPHPQQRQPEQQQAPPSSEAPASDLRGFRFPYAAGGAGPSNEGAPAPPSKNGPSQPRSNGVPVVQNGRSGQPRPSMDLAPPAQVAPQARTPPQKSSAFPSSPPLALTRGSPVKPPVDIYSSMEASSSQRSPPPAPSSIALQQITNPSLEKVAASDYSVRSPGGGHRATPSDASIEKFLQAGREVGFDDERLNQMLQSNGMHHRSGSMYSSRSRLSSAPMSPQMTSPREAKPAPRLTLGWGKTGIDQGQFDMSQWESPVSPPVTASHVSPPMPAFQQHSMRLQPPPAPRVPSTVEESPALTERALSAHTVSDVDPHVIRRTIVMVEEQPSASVSSPSSSPVRSFAGGRKLPPSPLMIAHDDSASPPISPAVATNGWAAAQAQATSGTEGPNPKRANSVRRKPVPLTSPIEPNPRHPGLHIRTDSDSNTSDAKSGLPSPRYEANYYGNSEPASATSSGFPHSTSSFLDYYNETSPVSTSFDRSSIAGGSQRGSQFGSQFSGAPGSVRGSQFDRGSQALEITEYADGRVVWNIVDALRSVDGHAAPDAHARGSVLSTHSQRSSYNGSRRDSEMPEDGGLVLHGGGSAAGLGAQLPAEPWKLGPTAGLSFIRRPETRVYYTSSADVADLIDQLSSDPHSGGSRGRIDIFPTRPGAPGVPLDAASPEMLASPTSPLSPSPFGGGGSGSAGVASGLGFLRPGGCTGRAAAPGGEGGQSSADSAEVALDLASPSTRSYGSDMSGGAENSVEDRLQALMDRLRNAPGGVTGVIVE